MKSSRLATTIVAMSLTGALGLSACGAKTKDGGTDAAAAGSTVNYWTSWPADTPQAKIFADAAKAFTKDSGIKVNIRTLGATAQQDITNSSATGTGPDMFDNAPDHLPAFRSAGLIDDLSDVLKAKPVGENEPIESIYPQSVIKSASDDKGLGFVPHTILSGGVWFDQAKFPDYGTNPPKTWDDLTATFKKLKADGKVPIAQEGGNASYNVLWFYWLMLRSKGPGSVLALSQSADAWDDPAVLEAAKQVDNLRTAEYFQNGYAGSRYPNAQNAWAQGKYVFDLNGSWLAGEVKSVLPGDAKLSTFPFPTFGANSQDVVELNTLGWSVNAKGKNKAGAKKFIEFLTKKEWLSKIGSDALNIPARTGVDAPESLRAMQKAALDSQLSTGYMDTAAANAPTWYQNVLLPLDDQLIFGKVSPEEFVKQGKAKTADYIKQGVK